jgi:hypothetical protein
MIESIAGDITPNGELYDGVAFFTNLTSPCSLQMLTVRVCQLTCAPDDSSDAKYCNLHIVGNRPGAKSWKAVRNVKLFKIVLQLIDERLNKLAA